MKLFRIVLFITTILFVMTVISGCQEAQKTQKEPIAAPEPVVTQKSAAEIADVEEQGEAVIEVLKTTHDFGKVGPRGLNKCEFEFKNIGTGALHIKKIHAPCGCTVPELTKKDYAPGESGTMKVKFRPSTQAGPTSKNIYIHSNDKKNPKFKLTVKAVVEFLVKVTPDKLQLSLKEENAGIGKITLTSKTEEDFAITGFSSTKDTITFDYDPTVGAKEIVIEPKVDMAKLKKQLNGNIRIKMTHSKANQVNIRYNTPPLFKVTRPMFVIQKAEPGKPVTRDVWIISNYDEPFEIESITPSKNYMEVARQEQGDNRVKLIITVTPPPQEGKLKYFTDNLKIKIKDSQELLIRCSGRYAKPPVKPE